MIPDSTPISLDKAKLEIQQRKQVYEPVAKATALLAEITGAQDTKTFFKSDANAFLFDKESVLRHFFTDPKSIRGGGAEQPNSHLVVVLGAHDSILNEDNEPSGFAKSTPTVIIAGVSEIARTAGQNPKEYYFQTVGGQKPADEYPPVQTIDELGLLSNSIKILI